MQCGTPAPSADTIGEHAQFFQVPVEKAATGGPIPAVLLEKLELAHRIRIMVR